jgi:hypothetical protein
LEENKIAGIADVIGYVMRRAWFAGLEEGGKYPLTLAEDLKQRTEDEPGPSASKRIKGAK